MQGEVRMAGNEGLPRLREGVESWLPKRFWLRIAPRRHDSGQVPGDAYEIPRGDAPARKGRPVVATVAVLALALGIWVQVDRFQDCRADGGRAIACMIVP